VYRRTLRIKFALFGCWLVSDWKSGSVGCRVCFQDATLFLAWMLLAQRTTRFFVSLEE
jgi:hypothetical protein